MLNSEPKQQRLSKREQKKCAQQRCIDRESRWRGTGAGFVDKGEERRPRRGMKHYRVRMVYAQWKVEGWAPPPPCVLARAAHPT
jgi:hypothetical protein